MEEALRKDLIEKLFEIRKLGKEVRNRAGLPAIEAYMRFVDMNCVSALWQLGELNFWEFRLSYEE